ncbi:MAG TPA: PucR family transcriptional regulator [Microlunatus sp.]|nr:PucR family transcriptional regulator [Microlunatus sp.]
MTTRLTALLADRELGLRLLSGRESTEVGWAHSSDLLEPTPFLEVDNLLLTTGTQFAADAPASTYDDYVRRLLAVGVAALGFGTEVVRVTPEPLVAACAQQDLPLVEVPYRTPFLALARRIADARAEQDHARDLWALDAQRALSLAALSAERLVGVLEELSRRLAAVVLLLDARGEVLSEQGRPRFDDTDVAAVQREARRLLHRRLRSGSSLDLPIRPAGPGRLVTMQTLGRRDELRGVLAVALAERPDAAATAVITSAVALAEFAVEDAARREESTLAMNAQLFQLALVGHVEAARDVLAAAGRQLPEAPLRLLLTPLPSDSEAGELEHALTVRTARSQQWVLATRWQGRFVAVVGTGAARAAADVIVARQNRVVMSRPVGWADLVAALHETRDALDAAPVEAGVIELETSAILGLLSRDEIESLAKERLTPLLRAPDGADLRRVLETWLRHNAAWDPAARELGMHRHTLKSQVRRAGSLVRLDLDTFEAKAELWALLTAAGSGAA